MEDNMTNNVNDAMEKVDGNVYETYPVENESVVEDENVNDSNLTKIVTVAGIAAAAAIGSWAYRNRKRLEKRKIEREIKRLEKRGYVVNAPAEIVDVEDVSEEDK